jgi:hypothetical protein
MALNINCWEYIDPKSILELETTIPQPITAEKAADPQWREEWRDRRNLNDKRRENIDTIFRYILSTISEEYRSQLNPETATARGVLEELKEATF